MKVNQKINHLLGGVKHAARHFFCWPKQCWGRKIKGVGPTNAGSKTSIKSAFKTKLTEVITPLKPFKNRRSVQCGIKTLIIVLQILTAGLVIYLVILPFYPAIKYKLTNHPKTTEKTDAIKEIKEETEKIKLEMEEKIRKKNEKKTTHTFPRAEYSVSPDRLIIPKIGVNAPIIESQSSAYGLSRGVWRLPESSTPDKNGNTVISGHRFKYLPPNNLTFYLLDKMKKGDPISIIWKKRNYFYKVKEVKIVDKTDFSILKQTETPTLTLFTCHPIYSTAQRLVVVAELINR